MNKKGFTLIELIVTIGLLGLVGVVISVNMVNTINKQNEKKKQEAIELIEEAGCAYAVKETTKTYVTGGGLATLGYIESEINGIKVSDYVVRFTYVDGERICTAELR